MALARALLATATVITVAILAKLTPVIWKSVPLFLAMLTATSGTTILTPPTLETASLSL